MTEAKRTFKVGDVVDIPKSTSPSRSHFSHGRATLLYNYAQKYGGGRRERKIWGVAFEKGGQSAWYEDDTFVLVKPATLMMELKARRMADRE